MEDESKKILLVKRYEFWIAVIALATTVFLAGFNLYKQSQTLEKIGILNIAIKDTDDIRKSLSKPIEGLWEVKLIYSKFHGEEGAWESNGSAMVKWDPSNQNYKMLIGLSLREIGGSSKKLVTWWMEGNLHGDLNGEPEEPFEVDVQYKGLTGIKPEYCEPGREYAKIKNVKIVARDNQNKVTKMEGTFDGIDTKATVEIMRITY